MRELITKELIEKKDFKRISPNFWKKGSKYVCRCQHCLSFSKEIERKADMLKVKCEYCDVQTEFPRNEKQIVLHINENDSRNILGSLR